MREATLVFGPGMVLLHKSYIDIANNCVHREEES